MNPVYLLANLKLLSNSLLWRFMMNLTTGFWSTSTMKIARVVKWIVINGSKQDIPLKSCFLYGSWCYVLVSIILFVLLNLNHDVSTCKSTSNIHFHVFFPALPISSLFPFLYFMVNHIH